jgi:predicted glycosyltransferase
MPECMRWKQRSQFNQSTADFRFTSQSFPIHSTHQHMKRILFYCQHILGIGHLVRSMEIVRGLTKDFKICFINGGEVVKEFDIPDDVEVVNLPAIKTDSEFKHLQTVDSTQDLAEVQEFRKQRLLEIFDEFQPDILMIELFPFGRGKFAFELVPLLEKAQEKAKVVCSLRDIVVTKKNQAKHEEKACNWINQYFDLVLIHGDPKFQQLEETFSRVHDLNCDLKYTGYVVQPQPQVSVPVEVKQPLILVSIGGGRFGHDLIDCVVESAPILEQYLPHQIQVFTGPFMPDEKFAELQKKAANSGNLRIDRFTPNLLSYMQKADLSISMSGYNTTMNVLTTGIRSMLMAFTGNNDQEQRIRAEKLEKLGVVDLIYSEELQPEKFAQKVITCLRKQPTRIQFDFDGVEKTSTLLKTLVLEKQVA